MPVLCCCCCRRRLARNYHLIANQGKTHFCVASRRSLRLHVISFSVHALRRQSSNDRRRCCSWLRSFVVTRLVRRRSHTTLFFKALLIYLFSSQLPLSSRAYSLFFCVFVKLFFFHGHSPQRYAFIFLRSSPPLLLQNWMLNPSRSRFSRSFSSPSVTMNEKKSFFFGWVMYISLVFLFLRLSIFLWESLSESNNISLEL